MDASYVKHLKASKSANESFFTTFKIKRYKNGLLKAKGNTTETKRIVEEATINLMKAYEQDGANSIEEWEVDELIEWTNGLNYDELVKINKFH
jgi:hypothetical protein